MKISVIIPAYNHEQYIEEAISSVLNQSCPDFELIIVNDGSTDFTEQKILSIHDPRIQYVSQPNRGAHFAINRGIALSQGEYISILNSDDVYLPKRLETCLNFLENNSDYEVVISTIEGIDSLGAPADFWSEWYRETLSFFEEDKFYPSVFTRNIMISTSNLFARRRCFEECGGFRALRYTHDWDMLLRLAKRYRLHLIREKLLKYRVHHGNTIHEPDGELKVRFEVSWVIAENLKDLNADVSLPELAALLRKNPGLSFETMFFLSLLKDKPVSHDFVDFKNFQTVRLLQMGISTDGSQEQTIKELQDWIQKLQTGNDWQASQRDFWEKKVAEQEQTIKELQDWIQKLQTGNDWLASQRDLWEKKVAEQGRTINELQAWAQELQAGNDRLTSQCDAWEQVNAALTAQSTEQASRLKDATERLKKIESHRGVRLLNRLMEGKLF